ncbi:hypothetical protein D3C75_1258340 [compost metagenome]
MTHYKRRLNQCFLNKLLKERIEDMAEGHVLLNRHTVLLSQTLGFLIGHLNAKVNTRYFFNSINHGYTAPSR